MLNTIATSLTTKNSILVGFASGLAVFLASRFIWDIYQTSQRRNRLLRALLTDCSATLSKFDNTLDEIAASFDLAKKIISKSHPPAEQLAAVKELLSGVVLSEPLPELKELVTLLGQPNEARTIVHYFDRWNRFFAFEQRYAVVHDKLLNALGEISHKQIDTGFVEDEYWTQARDILKVLHQTGRDLCNLSCKLYRRFGPTNDCDLPAVCGNRWRGWIEHRNEWNEYGGPDAGSLSQIASEESESGDKNLK